MRLSLLIPAAVGAVCAVASSTEIVDASHTAAYTVNMLPPAGYAGQSPTLTCGWHDQACGSAIGNYLDWDNTDTSNVYFRGFFTRASSPYETSRLYGQRYSVQGGSSVCEIKDVRMREASGLLRGVVRFVHISLSSTANFAIATSGSGAYNARLVGSMVNDSGCPLTGTHVHAGYALSPSSTSTKSKNTSRYPSGDYCLNDGNSSDCRRFVNNSSTNWTHRFTWTGP
jgi:hypothetical protein